MVEEKQIAPHIPVLDKSKREDGTFSRKDFRYDESTDTYICPGGKTLTTTGRINAGDTLFYRSSMIDCAMCQLKAQCCPKAPFRRVPRSLYERAGDAARSFAGTEAFEQSRHDRKRIEMRFAHLKRILRLGRLRHPRPAWRPRRVRAGGDRPEPEPSGEAGYPAATVNRSASCDSSDDKDLRILDRGTSRISTLAAIVRAANPRSSPTFAILSALLRHNVKSKRWALSARKRKLAGGISLIMGS